MKSTIYNYSLNKEDTRRNSIKELPVNIPEEEIRTKSVNKNNHTLY